MHTRRASAPKEDTSSGTYKALKYEIRKKLILFLIN
jgi:hypothetical protein